MPDPTDSPIPPDLLPANARATISLAEVVERLAAGQPRDEGLVRRVARWWTARKPNIRLAMLDGYPATDVMVTFRMDGRVALVVTGRIEDPPADLTIQVSEQDFGKVQLVASPEPFPDSPSIATLDYGVRGREFVLLGPHDGAERGQTGEAICLMTIDEAVLLRGRIRGGRRMQIPEELFELGP